MEYLHPAPLAARIQEGRSRSSALRLTAQIARHIARHPPARPSATATEARNILFRPQGRPAGAVGFGLAKDLGVASNLTQCSGTARKQHK